jgi:hypothetical protein
LSRAAVELGRDSIQRRLVELAEVGALGQLLAEQAVVFSLVPCCQGLLAEVDLDAGVDGDLQVFGHLPAIAAVALDQGPDGAGSLAEHQVAFPVPRHRSGSCWMPSGCRDRA